MISMIRFLYTIFLPKPPAYWVHFICTPEARVIFLFDDLLPSKTFPGKNGNFPVISLINFPIFQAGKLPGVLPGLTLIGKFR